MSTIQDVARHAAVSVSTVSNVLNGRTDQMKQETLERVKAAMEVLQYRPSTLARQLKTGRRRSSAAGAVDGEPDAATSRARSRPARRNGTAIAC